MDAETGIKPLPICIANAQKRPVGRKIKICAAQPGTPLKTALAIVTLPLILSACAGLSPQANPPSGAPVAAPGAEAAPPPVAARKPSAKSVRKKPEDPLPAVTLTDEILYKFLSAEIGAQRGQWKDAYLTMMATAQQTHDPRLAYRAMEIALGERQLTEAFAASRLWLTLAPHSEEALQYYLEFIVKSGNLAEAQPILVQRLQDAPPQDRGLMILRIHRLLSNAKDKNHAFTILEEVLKPYDDIAETHMGLAQSASAKGDVARAVQEAQTALKLKPDSELAALNLAQVMPDKNDATRELGKFVAEHPKARDTRVAYARILVEQKQYDAARREFEAMLKTTPEDLVLLYALGALEIQTEHLKSAEKHLTTYLDVLATRPDDERDPTQVLLTLAQIAEERKDIPAAIKWLAKIEPGEAYLGAQIKQALLVAKGGNIAAAQKRLADINTEGEHQETQVLQAQAKIFSDAHRLLEASALLETALKRFPNNVDLLYDYALLADRAEKLDLMETTLRKIIKLEPNNQHAYNALGYSLADHNLRLPEAAELIGRALKLAPEDPYIMDSMGWVRYRLGQLKEAEDLLRQAYALRPDADIAVHLGEVLWVKGQKDDAHKFWRDAKTKDPQNDALKSTLTRLRVRL
jgi:tetratricopeptide (TPR) repeat protein